MSDYGLVIKNTAGSILISDKAESLHFLGSLSTAESHSVPSSLSPDVPTTLGHAVEEGGIFVYSFYDLVYDATPILVFIAAENSNVSYSWVDHYMVDGVLKVHILFDHSEIAPPRVLVFSTLSNSVQYTPSTDVTHGIKVTSANGVVTYDSRFLPLTIVDTQYVQQNSVASTLSEHAMFGNEGSSYDISSDSTAFSYRAVAYGAQYGYSTGSSETRCNSCRKLDPTCLKKYRKTSWRKEFWSYYKPGLKLTKGAAVTAKWVQHAKLSAYGTATGNCVVRIAGAWSLFISLVGSLLNGSFISAISTEFVEMLPVDLAERTPGGTYYKATNTTQDTACNTALFINSGLYMDNIDTVLEPKILYSDTIDVNTTTYVTFSTLGVGSIDNVSSISADNDCSIDTDDSGIFITPATDFIGVSVISLIVIGNLTGTGLYPLATLIDVVIKTIDVVVPEFSIKDIPAIIGILPEFITTIPVFINSNVGFEGLEVVCPNTDDALFDVSGIELLEEGAVTYISVSAINDSSSTISLLLNGEEVASTPLDVGMLVSGSVKVLSDSRSITSTIGTELGVSTTNSYTIINEFTTEFVSPVMLMSPSDSYIIYLKDDDTTYMVSTAGIEFATDVTVQPLHYFNSNEVITNGGEYTLSKTYLASLTESTYTNINIDRLYVTGATVTPTDDAFLVVVDSLMFGELTLVMYDDTTGFTFVRYFSIEFNVSNITSTTTLLIPRTDNTDVHPSYEGLKIKWDWLLAPELYAADIAPSAKVRVTGTDDYITVMSADDVITTSADGINIELCGEFFSVWSDDDTSLSKYPEKDGITLDLLFNDVEYTVPIDCSAIQYLGQSVPFSGAASLLYNTAVTRGSASNIIVPYDSLLSSRVVYANSFAVKDRTSVVTDREDIVDESVTSRYGKYNVMQFASYDGSTQLFLLSPSILDHSPSQYLEVAVIDRLQLSYEDDITVTTDISYTDYAGFQNSYFDTREVVVIAEADSCFTAEHVLTIQAPYEDPTPTVILSTTTVRVSMTQTGVFLMDPDVLVVRVNEGTAIELTIGYPSLWDSYYVPSEETSLFCTKFESFSIDGVFDCSEFGDHQPYLAITANLEEGFIGVLVTKFKSSSGVVGEVRHTISFILDETSAYDSLVDSAYFSEGTILFTKNYMLTSESLTDIGITYSAGSKWIIPSKTTYGQLSNMPPCLPGSLWDDVEYNDILLPMKKAPGLVRETRIYKDPKIHVKTIAPVLHRGDAGSTNWLMQIAATPELSGFSIVDKYPDEDSTFTIEVDSGGEDNSPVFSIDIDEDNNIGTVYYTLPDNSDPVVGGSGMLGYKAVWVTDGETYEHTYYEFINYTYRGRVVEFHGNTQFNSTFKTSISTGSVAITPAEYTSLPTNASLSTGVWFDDDGNDNLVIKALPNLFGNMIVDLYGEQSFDLIAT